MADPSITSTIGNFITAGASTVISYANLSYIDIIDEIEYPIANVLDNYISDLKKQTVTVVFSEAEYLKYKYKPRLLSYNVYGNTELYFVILALNNICTAKEFNSKSIQLLTVDNMNSFMTSIYTAEKAGLDTYNSKNNI